MKLCVAAAVVLIQSVFVVSHEVPSFRGGESLLDDAKNAAAVSSRRCPLRISSSSLFRPIFSPRAMKLALCGKADYGRRLQGKSKSGKAGRRLREIKTKRPRAARPHKLLKSRWPFVQRRAIDYRMKRGQQDDEVLRIKDLRFVEAGKSRSWASRDWQKRSRSWVFSEITEVGRGRS